MKLAQLQEARYAGSDEDMFWDFVEHAQWNKDHDYDRIQDMLKHMDLPIAEKMQTVYNEAHDKLHQYLDNEVEGVSDDGYSDLLSHIIGSGRDVFNAALNDWKVAQDIIDRNEYEEGFQYIWHFLWD
jgi:hypothetical protein